MEGKINTIILATFIVSLAVLISCNYKVGIIVLVIIFISIVAWNIQRKKTINKLIYLMLILYPINDLIVIRLNIIDIRLVEILFLFLFIEFLLCKIKDSKIHLDKLPVTKFIMIFLISVLISTLFSINPLISFKEFIQYICIFLLFWLLETNIKTYDNFRDISNAVIIGNIMFILGLFIDISPIIINVLPAFRIEILRDFSIPIISIGNGYRVSIHSMGSVESANYALILIYLCIASKKVLTNQRMLCNTLIIINILILILTFSRAAWVFFLVTFIIYRHLGRKSKMKTILMLCLGLLITLSIPSVYERIINIVNISESSNKDHFTLWLIAMKIGMDNFIFGIGPGTFIKSVVNYEYLIRSMGAYTQSMDTHNLFLQAFSEQGIIGVLTLSSLIMFILYSQNKKLRECKERKLKEIKICLFLAFISTTLMSLTMNAFKNELYWIVVSLLISSDKYLCEENTIEKT